MIVRDEAHVVTECLESVASHIDRWVVVDTGSVDDTPRVIESFFAERGIPGELFHRPWQDFGTNRSEALELCRGQADYALVMDADDVMVGTPDFSGLVADGYLVRMRKGVEYWRTLLLRLDRPWRYEGVVHEYPVCGDGPTDLRRLSGNVVVTPRRLGARSRDPETYLKDARLLEEAIERDPTDARAAFYLAQSWFDAGDHEAALSWYRHRATMGGWDEEVFYSLLRVGHALGRLQRPWAEVLDAYLTAWQARPSRAEPLIEIASHYRHTGAFELGHLFAQRAAAIPFPSNDLLFVDTAAHSWRPLDELSICAFQTGRHQESFALTTRMLDSSALPDAHWERVLANRDLAIDAIREETLVYPEAVVEFVTGQADADDADVTLTITTCKRPELFEATMNSFLNCCADVDRIGRWLCVDDGSDPADLERMAERYPFLEFVQKPSAKRGHAGSMECLRATVTTPWWFHLEDDWHFVVPGRYVARAIEILEADEHIGQVLVNRNYGEVLDDRRLAGGEVDRTPAGRRFRRHVHHRAGTPAYDSYLADFGPDARTNTWWPHFSLRPSMLRTAALSEVGPFRADVEHFELDYASRYSGAGWTSAFFDQIVCTHLGPRTFDRGEKREANAYDLNDQPYLGKRTAGTDIARVALVPNWTTPETLVEQWARQTPGGAGEWGTVQLTADPVDADLTVVLNHPPSGTLATDPASTVVLPMEPSPGQVNWSPGERRSVLQIRNHDRYHNPWEWHLDRTYDELRDDPIDKQADLSVVISDRCQLPGQRGRLALVHHLEAHDVPIDVYGRCESEGFGNHQGRLPDLDKSAGLFPYRYTIAVENMAERGYVTEKLIDAVLAEALCFYWGAPDIADLIDPDAFIHLPLEDLDVSRRRIVDAIRNDEWARRLPAIRAEKRRILDEEQVMPVLDRIARGQRAAAALDVRVINLDRRPDRWEALNRHVADVAPALAARLTRWPAVDGQELTGNPEIERLFRHNDFGWRRGVIGCAVSHLQLWQQIAMNAEPTLILEDDVTVDDRCWGELVEALGLLDQRHPDFDLAYLGFTSWPGRPPRARPAVSGPLSWQPLPWAEYLGGTFAYLVSPAGARQLLAVVEERGFTSAVDVFLRRPDESMQILECRPHLFTSQNVGSGPHVDSDTQDAAPLAGR